MEAISRLNRRGVTEHSYAVVPFCRVVYHKNVIPELCHLPNSLNAGKKLEKNLRNRMFALMFATESLHNTIQRTNSG